MKRQKNILNEKVDFGPPLKGKLHVNDPYGKVRPYEIHPGVDLYASSGTDVFSVADGTVTHAEVSMKNRLCGGTIDIDFGEGYTARYCHIKKIFVNKGDTVKKGQLIGLSGGASGDPGKGNTTGAHLHISIRKGKDKIDPMTLFGNKSLSQSSGSYSDFFSNLFGGNFSSSDTGSNFDFTEFVKKFLKKIFESHEINSTNKEIENLFEQIGETRNGFKKLMNLTEVYDFRNATYGGDSVTINGGRIITPVAGTVKLSNSDYCKNGVRVYHSENRKDLYLEFCNLDRLYVTDNSRVTRDDSIGDSYGNVKVRLYDNRGNVQPISRSTETTNKPSEPKTQSGILKSRRGGTVNVKSIEKQSLPQQTSKITYRSHNPVNVKSIEGQSLPKFDSKIRGRR